MVESSREIPVQEAPELCSASVVGSVIAYPQNLEEMYTIGDYYSHKTKSSVTKIPIDLTVSSGRIVSRTDDFEVEPDSPMYRSQLQCSQCCIGVFFSKQMFLEACEIREFKYFTCSFDVA